MSFMSMFGQHIVMKIMLDERESKMGMYRVSFIALACVTLAPCYNFPQSPLPAILSYFNLDQVFRHSLLHSEIAMTDGLK